MQGKNGVVQIGELSKALVNNEDFAREPRPELAVAVAVPCNAQDAEADELGEPLGIRDVATLIGCSVWTVRQRCLRQGLPHFRASRTGRLIFYRNQVVRWLIENQTERRW
jgi:hypothetical protein